jgi:hypothetical protein
VLGFILSLFLTVLVSTVISGCLLTQNFDAKSQESSRFVSRFVAHAIEQQLNRLAPGLDTLSRDATIWRKTAFQKIDDFARQHGLEQLSVYVKPKGQNEYVTFTTLVPRDHQIFTYVPGKFGWERMTLGGKDPDSLHYRLRFPHQFSGIERRITLIRVDDKLYLDINQPLQPGVIRMAMPLPDSFLTKMEKETGHRISLYNSRRQYIAGILEPDVEIPDEGYFTNHGIDGVDYINYASSVMIEGFELVKVVISLERDRLTGTITKMVFIIFGASAALSVLVWGGFYLYRRNQLKLSRP